MYDKGERYYEDTPVYGATADDIDMAAVERYTELRFLLSLSHFFSMLYTK